MEFGGVGCCALVVRGKKILTIECAKGREQSFLVGNLNQVRIMGSLMLLSVN